HAFYGCSGLTSITIPNSVTKVSYYAFDDCDGLTSITIPNSVKKIGYCAFYYCDGLTSIIIPDSVTEIGRLSYSYCSRLTSVFCERTTPPTAYWEGFDSWSAFDDNAADRKIYVPTESVDAYKSADGWKDYADSIEPYDFSAISE
ncbi:MAG: leucine-rich repeat domain-containing protein, partial [Alistipes sp.]|nr:leucine-rich repeat domain-containing protein [Alistipes sp.]